VQLMTVHAVKGLEARCVWVVDADPHETHGAEPGVLVDWPVEHDAPRRVAFVADLGKPCASLVDLHAREQSAAQREELNALYVAMTRARDLLVFSRTAPRRSGGIGWWSRVLPHSDVLDMAAPRVHDPARVAGEPITVPELPRLPVAASAATPITLPSYAARLGRAMHRVLQWASAGAADLETLATAAVAEFDLPPSAASTAASYARTIRDNPELQRFFDAQQLAWSADEFDIAHEGELLRLDRLVRFGPEHDARWWVLDYKLTRDAAADPALRQQLQRYRSAVRLLTNGAPVHAAFITGDGALHELEPDSA